MNKITKTILLHLIEEQFIRVDRFHNKAYLEALEKAKQEVEEA